MRSALLRVGLGIAWVWLTVVAAGNSRAQVYADRESQLEIWNLRCEGRYADALAAARALRVQHRDHAATPTYVHAYDEPQVASLERAARLSPAEQEELADVDAMGPTITDAHGRGDYATAHRLSEKQLEVYRRLLGASSFDVARTLDNLAFFDELMGDLRRAEQRVSEAEALTIRLFGPGHPEVAWRQSKRANILHGRGRDEEAEALFRTILASRMATLGATHAHVAGAHNDLAAILRARGEYAAADEEFRRALAIQRRTDGPRSVGAARSLDHLATLARERGDVLAAEELWRESIAIRREALGADHPQVATSLVKLAGLLSEAKRFALADSLLGEASRIRAVAFAADNPRRTSLRVERATVLRQLGRLEIAQVEIDSALAIQEVKHGRDHPLVAATLWQRGLVRIARGNHAGEDDLDAALAIHRTLLGEAHPIVVQQRVERAAILQARGENARALELLEAAAQGFESARRRVSRGPQRSTFTLSPYPRLALARLRNGDAAGAWKASEMGSARTLADMVQAAERHAWSQDESQHERTLRADVLRLESQLGVVPRAEGIGDDAASGRSRDDIRRALHRAEADWLAFDREMTRRHPSAGFEPPALVTVQSRLDDETAILGWLDLEAASSTESWAYVIRRTGPVQWTRLPAIAGDLSRLRNELVGASNWPFRVRATARIDERARQGWDVCLAPLAATLDSVTALVVVPSAALSGVPLEVLQDPEGRPAGTRWRISYTPSLTLWARPQAPSPARFEDATALLVGDPQLRDESPANIAPAFPPGESVPIVLRSALGGNVAALRALPTLPGTQDELRTVREFFGHATLLTGRDATEERLAGMARRDELRRFDVLHLATHAVADAARPERSALVLSYPGKVEIGERVYDGLVDAREIVAEWRLNADLVTLSACRTVDGGVWGNDGELGLAAAMLQAGARTLLVTSWPVDDRAASLLVRRFYENLDGRNGAELRRKDAALQEARAWLRAQTDATGEHPFEHPVYWCGFVLVGDVSVRSPG